MQHLGDITKISGYTAPVVDCIIGGSPCQDLSVAGKRAGLDGERSGLFMEQIRIVKEMRENDRRNGRSGVYVRPRYMVWENVPGAFSSNKGEDFRIVLEEIAKISEENISIPRPENGKWRTSGCIVGDGWSVAWRVLDAQFWGVPQRRRRIALVADFGGQSAHEILFVSQSLSGHPDESQPQRKKATTDASRSVGTDDREGAYLRFHLRQDTITSEKCTPCISTGNPISGQASIGVVFKADDGRASNVTPTIVGDHNNRVTDHTALVVMNVPTNWDGGQIAHTLTKQNAGGNQRMPDKGNFNCVIQPYGIIVGDVRTTEAVVCVADHPTPKVDTKGTSFTLQSRDFKVPMCAVYALDRASFNQGQNAQFDFEVSDSGVNSPLVARGPDAVCYYGTRYIVRRLTPLECERLQGYPDGWTDIGDWTDSKGKVHKTSDAARYKALGNSIALPPWKWVLKRICACYERDATMASLFDGIGGFPYIWEQLNGKGSCLWASEIEEFPIAVTKVRIGQ